MRFFTCIFTLIIIIVCHDSHFAELCRIESCFQCAGGDKLAEQQGFIVYAWVIGFYFIYNEINLPVVKA